MHNEAAEYLDEQASNQCPGSTPKSWELPPTIFHAIDSSSLPAQEKPLARLAQEGFVLIAAGTDSTSRALTYAIYHLLANSDLLDRLQTELSTIMPVKTSQSELRSASEPAILGKASSFL